MRAPQTFAVLLLLVLLASALPAGANGVTEVSDTLYVVKEDQVPSNVDVAVTLSQATPLAPTRVLMGRDDLFVDSMASGVLQGESPLLLVPPGGPVPTQVLDELDRLGADRVTLLGGEAAILPAVADELAGAGYTVDRRFGASRFETAIAIAEDAGDTDTAILARAFPADGAADPTQAFADSLAAGGMAAENGWPILLTQTDVLSGPTADYMALAGFERILIMGGTAAVSAAVEAEVRAIVPDVERIAGASRFDTGIEVAKELGADSAADVAQVTLVDGQGPDAWAGGFAAAAHSAMFDAPIVLGTGDTLPPATQTWLQGGARSAFAQDSGFRLTCVIDPDVCEGGRQALSLPAAVPVTFTPPTGATVPAGATVLVDTAGQAATITGGSCVDGASGPLPDGGAVRLTANPDGETCDLLLAIDLGDGVVQRERATYTFAEGTGGLLLVSADADGNAVGGALPDVADSGSALVYLSDGDPTGLVGDQRFHTYVVSTNGTELVDVTPQGTPGEGHLIASVDRRPRISAAGAYVAFHSPDPGLDSAGAIGTDTNNLYLRDVGSGTTTLASVDVQGNPVEIPEHAAVSGDGSVVAFVGEGSGPTASTSQVFIHDLEAGTVTVAREHDGDPIVNAEANVAALDLSADGSTLVLTSSSPTIVADDTNARPDVFAFSVATGAVQRVSVDDQGAASEGETPTSDQRVSVSADGSRVAFTSGATNLAGAGGTGDDVFLRDRAAGATLLVSRADDAGTHLDGAGRADLSGDGRWVTFLTDRQPLGDEGAGGCGVFLSEDAGPVRRVDVAPDGTVNSNFTCAGLSGATVSSSGLVVLSVFGDLVPGDTNGTYDVYLAPPG